MNSGGLENVKVDKEMMKYVYKDHIQYMYRLKTKKIKLLLKKKKKKERSYIIKKAKEAKQKCTEQLQRKAAKYDPQIFHLEEKLRKQ